MIFTPRVGESTGRYASHRAHATAAPADRAIAATRWRRSRWVTCSAGVDSFAGRSVSCQHELSQALVLAAQQLVIVSGPGGMSKTRLSHTHCAQRAIVKPVDQDCLRG